MKITKAAISQALKGSISALFVLGGVAAVGYGAWQIYHPAAWIVVGVALVWMGLPEK